MFSKLMRYVPIYFAHKSKKTRISFLPIQVSIEPTNICNFKCTFCNQSAPDHFSKRKAGMVDLKNYEVILEKIKKECNKVKIISLTLDGEPSLHKDLPQIIKKANQEGFFVRFSSNGSKINRDFLEKTRDLSYLISIDFSFDKDGFEKCRGDKSSWYLIKENLEEMVKYLRINRNLFLEIFENSAYFERKEKADSNLKIIRKHFGKNRRLTYGLRIYHKILDDHIIKFQNNKYYGCIYPWTSLNITWEGDVVTCCRDLEGKYILGNILKSSVTEVWNGKNYLLLRDAILKQNLNLIPSCRSCDMPYDALRHDWVYAIRKALRKW